MKGWPIAAIGAVLVTLAVVHRAPSPQSAIAALQPLGTGSARLAASASGDSNAHVVGSVQTARRGHALSAIGAPAGGTLIVYVAGEVRHPGLYHLRTAARANDAVNAAGGFTQQADRAAVNLAQPLQDGEEVNAIATGATRTSARTANSRKRKPRGGRSRTARGNTAQSIPVVNINAADSTVLAQLPGIGDLLAARIVEYRRLNGPFASVDELADVSGITQRRLDAIVPYVTVQ